MDGKQYPLRSNFFGANVERARPHVDRRKNNPSVLRDSSVDPVNAATIEQRNNFLSPRFVASQQPSPLRAGQMVSQGNGMEFFEQSDRMEKKLQQSINLLNHKQQMQHKLLLMQQQQIQQQRQLQQQQQQENEKLHQPQIMVQPRSSRQRSPDRQRHDANLDSQIGIHRLQQHPIEEMPSGQCADSVDDVSVQDLFTQCQNHLDVINACTDLQQTIKDEMKKQAKLDNIICQKLVSKAQRLQQQASLLQKAHAPSWVGPALLDLGSQVTQQAEVHHIYTATLLEQCVVIQHSLDGHHELMKSVLAEHSEAKQKSMSPADSRTRSSPASGADARNQGAEAKSMTFLQASNIFESIRKPRMKLLSSLEYQQDQLNATIMHLNQVDTEIEELSNPEETESLAWRVQLQKKDLEIRKEFLETRKDQLESDVQFARLDLSDFEFNHKNSLLEVLNVFRQHRVRYDRTLRQSFQLLTAASMRDISYLRKITKKTDLDTEVDLESCDIYQGLTSTELDPWGCTTKAEANVNMGAFPAGKEHDFVTTSQPVTLQRPTSPQINKNKSPYLPRNSQDQIGIKLSSIEHTYPEFLSSDSELSDLQKGHMYAADLKQAQKSAVINFNTSQFQNMTDFNFSRADSSSSVTDRTDTLVGLDEVPDSIALSKPPTWQNAEEKLESFQRQMLESTCDHGKFVISRYVDDIRDGEKHHFHCCTRGTEDLVIVTRGSKSKPTLGSFENYIESDCGAHCLYPMSTMREISCTKEEKRVAHLINKYASGGRSSRCSLGKNWNSCKPMAWSGISKGMLRENVSRRRLNRYARYCKLSAQHCYLKEYLKTQNDVKSEPLVEPLSRQNVNNSDLYLPSPGQHQQMVTSMQPSQQTADIKGSEALPDFNISEVEDNQNLNSGGYDLKQHSQHIMKQPTGKSETHKTTTSGDLQQHRQHASMSSCETVTHQTTDGSIATHQTKDSSVPTHQTTIGNVVTLQTAVGNVVTCQAEVGNFLTHQTEIGNVVTQQTVDNVVTHETKDYGVATHKTADGGIETQQAAVGDVVTHKVVEGAVLTQQSAAGGVLTHQTTDDGVVKHQPVVVDVVTHQKTVGNIVTHQLIDSVAVTQQSAVGGVVTQQPMDNGLVAYQTVDGGGGVTLQTNDGSEVTQQSAAGGVVTQRSTADGEVTQWSAAAGGEVTQQSVASGEVIQQSGAGSIVTQRSTAGGIVTQQSGAGGVVTQQSVADGEVTQRSAADGVHISECLMSSSGNEDVAHGVAEIQTASQNLGSCEQLPEQGSKNLNNCEPLKNHAVDVEAVVEREDQMDFEMIQVSYPDTQPRHVRVCAVRPISAEAGTPCPGQTAAKGLAVNHCAESQPRTDLTGKYANLRVYEITAGQFIDTTVAVDSKPTRTIFDMQLDHDRKKHPGAASISSEMLSGLECLHKSDVLVCMPHVHECRPCDTTESPDVLESPTVSWPLTSPKAVVPNPEGLHCQTVTGQWLVHTDVMFSGGKTRTVYISGQLTDHSMRSLSEVHVFPICGVTDLMPAEDTQQENVCVQENHLHDGNVQATVDEDETFSKTIYVPEHGSNLEVNTNRQPSQNLCHEMLQNTPKQSSRNITGKSFSTSEVIQETKNININEAVYSVADAFYCKDETHMGHKYEKNKVTDNQNSPCQACCRGVVEMPDLTSVPINNEINFMEGSRGDDCHLLQANKQACFKQSPNRQSPQKVKGLTNNPQQQNRPLKSSLKKPSITCSSGLSSNHKEAKENYKCLPQFAVSSVVETSASGVSPHTIHDTAQKCVKQVRFDHRVHYDDNTVTDTLDTSLPHNQPGLSQSLSTNTGCLTEGTNTSVLTKRESPATLFGCNITPAQCQEAQL